MTYTVWFLFVCLFSIQNNVLFLSRSPVPYCININQYIALNVDDEIVQELLFVRVQKVEYDIEAAKKNMSKHWIL